MIKFRNANILNEKYEVDYNVDLVVDGNIIKKIGKIENDDETKYERVIDAKGKYLIPGFKNAHSHTGMVFGRSLADDLNFHDWLFGKIMPLEDKINEEELYYFTMLGAMECMTSGITCNMDMYKYIRYLPKAYRDIGFRACVLDGLTMYDKSFDLEERYNEINGNYDGLVTYMFSLHSVYLNDETTFKLASDLTHKYKAKCFSHVAETKREVLECKEKWGGLTPVEVHEKYGLFDYGGGGYHCIYLEDNDIEIFKKHNLTAVTCPASNLKLASGICPVKKYMNEGIKIAIGTDGPASNNALDMFREMYLVSNLAKVVNNDSTAISSKEILKMAIENGAYAMDMPNTASLAEGNLADIVMLDLHMPNTEPQNDFVNNLVYACGKQNVKLTMINGIIKYEDGNFNISMGAEYIYKKCDELLRNLLARS